MAVSVFDLFKIGIGPSSSHTVGPMRAARLFVQGLEHAGRVPDTRRIKAELFGSLGATGKGHGSDKAVLLGLMGHEPDSVDVEAIPSLLEAVRADRSLPIGSVHRIAFDEKTDLVFHRRQSLPLHANGLRFSAFDAQGLELGTQVYYSVGGGFVVTETVLADGERAKRIAPDTTELPLPFHSGADLLKITTREGCTIAEVMRRNERHWRSDAEIDAGLLKIWAVMQACVVRGCATDGVLPGGFKVRRRAADLFRQLSSHPEAALRDPLQVLDWVNLYALAVNEENAAGGRVVTAPTNGAAGIVPAVLHYYRRFQPGASDQGVVDFLLTAAAIGLLYKENASISGAEVGCQGEVGRRLLDGRRRAVCGDGRHAGAGGERCRNRHGAPPRADLRPGRRAGADPMHRTQRDRIGQGHQRRPHGVARRRHPPRQPRSGDQDHARHRCRHDDEVQGNRARWIGRQHRGMLIAGPAGREARRKQVVGGAGFEPATSTV